MTRFGPARVTVLPMRVLPGENRTVDGAWRPAPMLHLMATGTATDEDVYEALEEVIDPELGLDFVSLGLVYDVEIEKDEAYITFTLTTPACPIGPQVSEQMREFVGQLQGIDKVHPKMVFDPPWSPEMMSEDAKFALGY
jgi:metal-sulfur cluster biosynthetic enzyme